MKLREILIMSALAVFLVGLAVAQLAVYAGKTPADRVFPLVHNFEQDYYWYLSLMRQGQEGQWLATSRMTAEAYPGRFVNVFLLFLGHLARIFRTDLPAMYTAARLVGTAALLLLIHRLARVMYPTDGTKRIVAMLLVVFGGSFFVPGLVRGWTELDPIYRFTFIPHHLWAKIGMVAAFLGLLKRQTVFLIALTVFMGLTNPVVYATFVPAIVIYGLWQRDWRVFTAAAAALLTSVYYRQVELGAPPWNSYQLTESMPYVVSAWEYAQSFGPALLFFLIAFPSLWKSPVGKLVIAWATSGWLMLFVLGRFVPLVPNRYLGGYQFIPVGIGAVEGIFSARGGLAKAVLTLFLVSVGFIGMSASWRQYLGYVERNQANPQIYVPKKLLATLAQLDKNLPRESVVLAPEWASPLIPAFTGMRSITGHRMMTTDYERKNAIIRQYWADRITPPGVSAVILPDFSVQ